jgi:cytochrome P450
MYTFGHVDRPLPPGPRLPSPLQTLLFFGWPFAFLGTCQRRYGRIFTINLSAPGEDLAGPIVYLADPAAIKQLFSLDGREGHAGAANSVLEPITGPHSILMLDREEHLQERRLIGPAFHGEALQRLEPIVGEAARREIAAWQDDSVFAVRPAMQRITFEVIMRAVLGVHDRQLQDRLLSVFEPVFNISTAQVAGLVPAFRVDLGPWSPWGRMRRALDRLDEVLLDLILERRRETPREDVLGLLLAATDSEGNGFSNRHVRDELVTFLLAGHETTATSLAWAFERLAHHPAVASDVREELAGEREEVLDAVAAETLRVRPVVMDVARRLSSEAEIGDFCLPAGTTVMPGIYLVHFDRGNYEDPEEFRPDRFGDGPPSRDIWLPFGGGRRRCLGAGFAQMEMRVVLSTVLRAFTCETASPQAERPRLRGVTFVPEHDARLRMRRSPLSRAASLRPEAGTAPVSP